MEISHRVKWACSGINSHIIAVTAKFNQNPNNPHLVVLNQNTNRINEQEIINKCRITKIQFNHLSGNVAYKRKNIFLAHRESAPAENSTDLHRIGKCVFVY